MKNLTRFTWALAFALGCSSGGRPAPPAAGEPALAVGAEPEGAGAPADEINPRLLRRFRPVGGAAAAPPGTPDKVALGRALFFEKRLSRNQEIACSSCHSLAKFGVDGQRTSTGVGGLRGTRNAPSVFNAATHVAQFWDGRSLDVEQQAVGPIMNPREMAMPSEQAVVAALGAVPAYVEMFRKAFPGDARPVSLKNVGAAIGAFERGLVTMSRWDRYLAGEHAALTAEEKRGLRIFLDTGCMACHTGPQVGGTMFQKVGALVPWPNQSDEGRTAVTKQATDRMVFKVPSLKNVAETAPYFHDGAASSLEEAIRLMGHHQLGVDLAPDEVKAIAAWMRSMTGEIDKAYIAQPTVAGGP